MAIDFPTSPSVGQVYVFGGVTYVFTASGVWSSSGAGLSVLALGAWAPQGRLTLQTLTPVMTATQSAKITLFYTPYAGNQIPLFNGTSFVMTAFNEISVATTDTTKNPAAIGASKVNDWFVWNDAGTLRLTHGPDWTSDTVRSAGTALLMVNGILLNNVSITNGPAAQRGTYVGTTRSNASSQLDWILGGVDTAASLFVWNTYNRVPVASIISASTSSWSYATGAVRQPNNAAFYRINIICGLNEDMVAIVYQAKAQTSVANGTAITGIGLNSTNGFAISSTVNQLAVYAAGTAMTVPAAPAIWLGYPGIGYNFWCALETGDNTNASTYFGESYSALYAQSLRM